MPWFGLAVALFELATEYHRVLAVDDECGALVQDFSAPTARHQCERAAERGVILVDGGVLQNLAGVCQHVPRLWNRHDILPALTPVAT